jgi:integrase
MKFDFFEYGELLYAHRYRAQEISFHTLENASSMLGAFRRFCQSARGTDALTLDQLDAGLLEKFKLFCVQRGNRTATINRKLVPIMVILKQAEEEGLVSHKALIRLRQAYYPQTTRRYGLEADRMARSEGETIHHLDDGQLQQLIDYYRQCPKKSHLDVLDLFFFSFHTCGLRVSDIITLEWSHIHWEQASLSKVAVKSKAPLTIPLSDSSKEILSRWEGQKKQCGRFVFGLLPDNFDLSDDAALAKAIDYRNRAIRQTLNRIGRLLDFPFPLGMHVARHTFAVKALNDSRVNVHMISRLLGHSSVLVTEKVYARFLLPTLSHELRNKLSFPEFGIEK